MNLKDSPIPQELIESYLNLLGLQREEPSIDALSELVRAHLFRVPFENISKLYYKKHHNMRHLPSLEFFLKGIDKYHFGGTCYSNNYYFYQLLAHLGYQVKLCGADMTNPDVHLVSIVTLDQREYLVDVGYAAPFWNPLPRDLTTEYEIELGRDSYVLKPQDAHGCSSLEMHRDGIHKHGYTVKPIPKQIGDFEQVISDSYRDTATFMNALLLVRFFPNRSIAIHNMTLIESQGTESKIRTLSNCDELIEAIVEYFEIPEKITLKGVKDLRLNGDAWN